MAPPPGHRPRISLGLPLLVVLAFAAFVVVPRFWVRAFLEPDSPVSVDEAAAGTRVPGLADGTSVTAVDASGNGGGASGWVGEESATAATEEVEEAEETRDTGTADVVDVSAPEAGTSEAARESGTGNELFLWKVRGGTGQVYLLGSVHVGAQDFYPLDPAILQAWNRSDRLAVEVDVMNTRSPDFQDAQRLSLSRMWLPDETTLADYLPEEALATFRAFCEEHGLGYDGYLTMQPWMIAQTITLWMAGQEGYTPFYGIDNFFLRNARALRRPVDSLETAVSQAEILTGQSMEAQMNAMGHMIESLESGEAWENLRDLLHAWRSGDGATILELMERERLLSPDHEAFYEQLLYRRNRLMAETIHERYLDREGTTFVVVGAAHLLGERSVQDYLRKRVPGLAFDRIAPVRRKQSGVRDSGGAGAGSVREPSSGTERKEKGDAGMSGEPDTDGVRGESLTTGKPAADG